MSTALYRRYRPERFADVIGQDHVTGPLRQALRADRINHAYLFSGPRGCGKTTSARILARTLNCHARRDAEPGAMPDEPCGVCPSCTDLARGGGGSLDVIEIDAASHNGVDDARELRERAVFAPARDQYKIFIIDEAHMVTPAGFNALLKIVEEPPPHVRFMFATTEPDKVIGTIRSRTHHYPFHLIPAPTLTSYLASLCEQEQVSVQTGVLPLVVRAGAGSARDSLSVLDQLIAGAGAEGLTYESAIALLGFTHASLLDDAVDALATHDGAGVFSVVDRVISAGHDPRRFVEDLLARFRDLVIIAATGQTAASVLGEMADDQMERLVQQASRVGQRTLTQSAAMINGTLSDMVGATSPRMHLELLMARLLLTAGAGAGAGAGAAGSVGVEHVGSAPVAVRSMGSAAGQSNSPAVSSRPGSGGPSQPGMPSAPAGVAAASMPAATMPAASMPPAPVPPAAKSPAGAMPSAPMPSAPMPPNATATGQPAQPGQAQAGQVQPGHEAAGAMPSAPMPSTPMPSAPVPPNATATGQSAQAGQAQPGHEAAGAMPSAPMSSAPMPSAPVPPNATATGQPAQPQPAQPGRSQQTQQHPGQMPSASSQPASSQPASSQPASSQPASSQPASSQPASSQPASSQPAPSLTAPAQPSGDLDTIRSMWTEIVAEVRNRGRATWAAVQYAHVHDVRDGALQLAFDNEGAMNMFQRGSHAMCVREVVRDVASIEVAVQAIPAVTGPGVSYAEVKAAAAASGSDHAGPPPQPEVDLPPEPPDDYPEPDPYHEPQVSPETPPEPEPHHDWGAPASIPAAPPASAAAPQPTAAASSVRIPAVPKFEPIRPAGGAPKVADVTVPAHATASAMPSAGGATGAPAATAHLKPWQRHAVTASDTSDSAAEQERSAQPDDSIASLDDPDAPDDMPIATRVGPEVLIEALNAQVLEIRDA